MEKLEPSIDHQQPRGGPIYLEDLVGPLIRVPEFEFSLDEELRSLQAELNMDSPPFSSYEYDLSVGELKLLSEEELVNLALKEALQVEPQTETPSQVLLEEATGGIETTNGEASLVDEALRENDDVGELAETPKKRTKGRRSKSNEIEKRKKRGRLFDRETRAAQLENPCFIEKIEQLARIKQKQDEDKMAARLHSFNGGCKVSVSSPVEIVGKSNAIRFATCSKKVKKSCNASQYGKITQSELVLCIEIYTKQKKTQELLVLGKQKLSDLRDEIYCSTDELMQKAGKHDPSGYFLIEEVFCNDKRDPGAIDYSEPILDWLRNSKNEAREKWERVLSGELQQKQIALLGQSATPPLPQFKAVEMHRIRFRDVGFRLGAGYMYCHQGDCKHLIVIRDMRRIHPEDVQNPAAYPVITFQRKTRYPKCDACKIYRATKVTVDDKWAQENPCYFCDNCYYLLHYSEDGSLLYSDFTVHDYHHE